MCFCSLLAAQVSNRRWQHFNIVQSSKKIKKLNSIFMPRKLLFTFRQEVHTAALDLYGFDEFMWLQTGRKLKF